MNILFLGTITSDKLFKKFRNHQKYLTIQTDVLYNKNIINSIKNKNNITVLSKYSFNTKNCDTFYLSGNVFKNYKNNDYVIPYIRLPIINSIIEIIISLYYVVKWRSKDPNNKIVICDALKLSLSLGALIASRICKIKRVAIITDLPYFMIGNKNNIVKDMMYKYLIKKILEKYNAYIVLTKEIYNFLRKKYPSPYIIIEGIVEGNEFDNIKIQKSKIPSIMYAGSLHEKYGIKYLVEAFQKINIKKLELWLYGEGDFKNEIINISKHDKRIKCFNTIEHNQILSIETKAWLLINPRSSNEEFTRYSFPSKNMEYLLSGTPVLCEALPGIPKEYLKYINIIKKEYLTQQIKKLIMKGKNKAEKKAIKAKYYIKNNKNIQVIGELLDNFISTIK